jgi:RNA polymerase sigma factor (sigma-70 family)
MIELRRPLGQFEPTWEIAAMTDDEQFANLLGRAKLGEPDSVNELLELIRPVIRDHVDRECGTRAAALVDVSGVTQVALLAIHRELARFRGATRNEFVSWAKQISLNRLLDEIRSQSAQKRDGGRIQSLNNEINPAANLATTNSSPSERATRNERFALAVSKLPVDQQRVAIEHFVEKRGIDAIAANIGVLPEEAALRLERTVRNLRKHLGELS